MKGELSVWVDGVGLWAPGLPDWAAFRAWLRGEQAKSELARPQADTLPPNERRRAPESVLLAVAAAGQAVAASGLAAADLPCVFASAHGDQSITDYMCATLADAPAELSPIRFHNSVHNAPAGYWTIATGCHAGSSAVSAGRQHTFGASLLEAATLAYGEDKPVLLAVYDTAGSGPLTEMTAATMAFATAFVLSPRPTARSIARYDIAVRAATMPATAPDNAELRTWMIANPSAAGIALVEALALGRAPRCELPAAGGIVLEIGGEMLA
jgi:Beta-ketoacyl synthase, N-terminal domain